MQYPCPTPRCGAVYDVTPDQVGRRLRCKNCGQPLVMEANGLRFADDAVTAEWAEEAKEEARPAAFRKRPDSDETPRGSALERITLEIPTILFGIGVFCVVIFLFLPLINHAREVGIQAKIAHSQSSVFVPAPQNPPRPGNPDPRVMSQMPNPKIRDLQKELEDTRVTNQQAIFWYLCGMLGGFLILAVAALGYLSPRQTTARRVVACIVLSAEVVLVFVALVVPGGINYFMR